jgi:hypothetical protein
MKFGNKYLVFKYLSSSLKYDHVWKDNKMSLKDILQSLIILFSGFLFCFGLDLPDDKIFFPDLFAFETSIDPLTWIEALQVKISLIPKTYFFNTRGKSRKRSYVQNNLIY